MLSFYCRHPTVPKWGGSGPCLSGGELNGVRDRCMCCVWFALLMFGTSNMVGNDDALQTNFSACRAEQLPCRNLQAFIWELMYSCYRRNWLWVSRTGGFLLANARRAWVMSDHLHAWQLRLLQNLEALEQWWGGWRAVCSCAKRWYNGYVARFLALTGRTTRNYNRSEPEQSPWHPNPNTVAAVQTRGHNVSMAYTINYMRNLLNL